MNRFCSGHFARGGMSLPCCSGVCRASPSVLRSVGRSGSRTAAPPPTLALTTTMVQGRREMAWASDTGRASLASGVTAQRPAKRKFAFSPLAMGARPRASGERAGVGAHSFFLLVVFSPPSLFMRRPSLARASPTYAAQPKSHTVCQSSHHRRPLTRAHWPARGRADGRQGRVGCRRAHNFKLARRLMQGSARLSCAAPRLPFLPRRVRRLT